jgi:hypothetical protein
VKFLIVVVLVILLIVGVMPVGMAPMTDCPACTVGHGLLALWLCAGMLALVYLLVALTSSRFRLVNEITQRWLLTRSIYRPPRHT